MNEPILFCDLKKEYKEHAHALSEALHETLLTADFCDGEQVRLLEREFAELHDVPYCSCVDSGTDALFLAMKALGIGEGDEVIVPANTFVATALAVSYNHATPVFCDCESDTWEISLASAERCVTPRTKAIVPVHLYGQACDMDGVRALAQSAGLRIIEDCAQAHGALYKGRKVGTFSDAGCYSFYPTKNIGAIGAAGALITPHRAVKERADSLRFYALDRQTGDHTEISYNMRMDSLQAVAIRYKLRRIDFITERRTQTAETYLREIVNPLIRMQTVAADCTPVWNLFCVHVPDRARFLAYMKANNIFCGVHYAVPCHLQGAFRDLGYKAGDLPACETHCAQCVTLPLHPYMSASDVARVVEACNRFAL